jgi:hypothetical protein
MMRNVAKLSVVATLLGGSLWACNGGETPDPQHAPPSTSEAPAAETKGPRADQPSATDLEGSSLADAEVPFILTVTPSVEALPEGGLPEGGVIELVATIESHTGFKTPTKIHVDLPPNAKLLDGEALETLADLPAGKTTRRFKVEVTGELSDPIKISVGMVDPHGRFGAHATRLYPEPEEATNKVRTSRVPKPPVGRPGQGLSRDPSGGAAAGPTQPGTR